jgi:hypothetical protein
MRGAGFDFDIRPSKWRTPADPVNLAARDPLHVRR